MYHAYLLLARCHLCGYVKDQTRVIPWLTRVLLYDWPLVWPITSSTCHHLIGLWSTFYLNLRAMPPLVHMSSLAWICVGYCLVYVSPFYWFPCQLVCPVIYFKSRTNTLKISFAFLHFDQLPNSLDLLISLLHPRFYISSFW